MTSPILPTSIEGVTLPAGGGGSTTFPSESSGSEQGTDFTKAISDALGSVSQLENAATGAAEAAAVGDLRSVSDYMIAATEAQLAVEITVAVRDRAIAAFNDIMRMQV